MSGDRAPAATAPATAASPATSKAFRASLPSLVVSEAIKMRRTWLVPLTLLGPLGVTMLGVILFALKGPDIVGPVLAGTMSGWQALGGQMAMVHVFTISLGAALLASMIVDVEHRSATWKQFLALPVSRPGAYLVKFAWGAALLGVSSALVSVGYAALMMWQRLGPIPADRLAEAAWLTWVAVLPLFGLQLLLSTAIRNQALPLAIGIVTPMFAMGLSGVPVWTPWRLTVEAMMNAVNGTVAGAGAGAAASLTAVQIAAIAAAWTLVLVAAGSVLLARRDVR
jgi:hypothetical protein